MSINKLEHILDSVYKDSKVAAVYAALLRHGPQTISSISRTTDIERTKMYRLIEVMKKERLVYVEVREHRQIYHAVTVNNLKELLSEKTKEISSLTNELEIIQPYLETYMPNSQTRVQYYHGAQGLKQMLWNQTRAKGEIVSILSENIQTHTSKAFFESWILACNTNQLTHRSIVDDNFINQQKAYYGAMSHSLVNWQARHISDALSGIPHRTTIYDSVTTYFDWSKDDLFGIEIYNQNIADMQRQFFELVWNASTPLSA